MSHEYIFKCIVIGDSGVGKSCILIRFTKHLFDSSKEATVGVEFVNQIIDVDGQQVKLQMWDTAGQEMFKSITRSYYRAVAGALVVYDITNQKSFDNVKGWIEEARSNANPHLSIILCGNKADMSSKRVVSADKGKDLADLYGIKFLEASALSGENVENLFLEMAREIKGKIEKGKIDLNSDDCGVKKIGEESMASKQKQRLAAEEARKKADTESSCC